MRIFVGQIYVEPGVSYPFSNRFQTWLGQELTSRVQPSQAFVQAYSDGFNLVFRVSAKSHITQPEIKGPTVFKRDRDVEFTIFLPYQASETHEYRRPLKLLFDSIAVILKSLGLDASRVVQDSPALVEHVISNKTMFKQGGGNQ